MSRNCKTLVIDACIANAAGESSDHPNSANARNFLKTVSDEGHKIGLTQELWEEWDKHQTYHAKTWLKKMVSKKQFHYKQMAHNTNLRESIEELQVSKNNLKAMLKDCHLLEAAQEFDKQIISSDDTAGNLFREASAHIAGIRHLLGLIQSRMPKQSKHG